MSDVKRYRVPEKWMIDGLKDGSFDASHNLKVVVLHSDYEQKVSDLTARIASLEREKEEARDKALEEAATRLAKEQWVDSLYYRNMLRSFIFGRAATIVRAMKGTKP